MKFKTLLVIFIQIFIVFLLDADRIQSKHHPTSFESLPIILGIEENTVVIFFLTKKESTVTLHKSLTGPERVGCMKQTSASRSLYDGKGRSLPGSNRNPWSVQ